MYSKEYVGELCDLFECALEYVIEKNKGGLREVVGYCAKADKPEKIVDELNAGCGGASTLYTYRENPEYTPGKSLEFATELCKTLSKIGPALFSTISLADFAAYYSIHRDENEG